MTHSRWCETGGSAEFQQQGKHIDGVRDRILPVQTRSPAESGCSYCCTQPPQTAFISAKPRKTATLTWSILSLWENSINSAAAIPRAGTESGSGAARVWPAPATRCHQLLDQRRSDPKMRLHQPVCHPRARLSHVPHIHPEKTGTFPLQTAWCSSLLRFMCLWLIPCAYSHWQLHSFHFTEKENPAVMFKSCSHEGCGGLRVP